MTDDTDAMPRFAILLVCTANQCRSPMAELVLRDRLQALGIGWRVTSAGTQARPGAAMNPSAAAALTELGLQVSAWRSQRLEPELIDAADLVLTAETAHRSQVVALRPDALRRTFPLLQFSRLAEHIPGIDDPRGPAAGDLLVEGALAARSHVQPGGERDELADPIGKRMRAYRACAETIVAAVDALTAPLSVVAEA